MANEDNDCASDLPEGVETWLTAPEVFTSYGASAPQLTKAAQEGIVRRARIKRPGEARLSYVYDPASLEEARANGSFGSANPAADGMLVGGSVIMGRAIDMATAMSQKVLAAIDASTRSQEAITRVFTAHADSMLAQFRRLDERNAANEQVMLDFIRMRNELATEKAEVEFEAQKSAQSHELKSAALATLIEHLEPILELVNMMRKGREGDEKAEKAEKAGPPSPASSEPASSNPSVVEAEAEVL